MPQKSPSKHLSLKYLVEIAENNFCNLDSGIDYEPSEVMDLIFSKQRARTEKHLQKTIREYARQDLEKMKLYGFKVCSNCKQEKIFKEFHTDKSKKLFGLTSLCRECRKAPPF